MQGKEVDSFTAHPSLSRLADAQPLCILKSRHLELKRLRLLPGKGLVGAEVAVLGRLEVDGLGQVQLLDNDTRAHVEVVADDLDQLVGRLLGCAVGLDEQRQRLSHTNGIRELHQGTAGEASSNQRLGDPATKVGSRPIDLGEVLARESTATVGTPAAIGVDNNLPASQASVTLGATDDEEARGLDLKRR